MYLFYPPIHKENEGVAEFIILDNKVGMSLSVAFSQYCDSTSFINEPGEGDRFIFHCVLIRSNETKKQTSLVRTAHKDGVRSTYAKQLL